MKTGKRTFVLYWAVAGLFCLVVSWWLVFFAGQGSFLVERMREPTDLALEERDLVALRPQGLLADPRALLVE